MAKSKSKSPAKAASAAQSNLNPEVAKKITELKSNGNNAFARGDYTNALAIYDEAIKLLPSAAAERADFHNNKAACFISQKRYKEAVKECTSALEVAPASLRALQRRAKAYEQQGLYKQALADMQTVNKSEGASPETQEQERRLREAAARRPASANGGASAATPGAAVARNAGPGAGKLPPSSLQQGLYTAKCSLGDETKLVHLSIASNYSDVLAAVRAKFPGAGPFAIKYLDRAGDLVTITSKADLHTALGELVTAYQRQAAAGGHGPKLTAFPPLKLHLVPVASQSDVPRPPLEEEMERAAMLAGAGKKADAAAAEAEAAPQPAVASMDGWLLDFANLFVQHTGLEPDKHVDLHTLGWDNVGRAMEATVSSEAAAPLFEKAKDSFRDVACTGLTSWGQVHQLLGQRQLEAAARAGGPLDEATRGSVLAEFALAEAKYREALALNADFFDAVCNMSQLEFERCKLAAGLLVPDSRPQAEAAEGEAKPAEPAADAAEALTAASRAALAKLSGEAVAGARPAFEAALQWADRAVALAPAMDARAKELAAKAAEAGASPQPAPAAGQQEYDFRAQALVLRGNFMYEMSQMLGAVGSEWRPLLDGAVALFREAGCPEKDIRGALRNHLKAAELDIPAEEPEEAKAEEKAAAKEEKAEEKKEAKEEKAAAKEEEKPKAKGLPSLEVKKAKK